MSTHEADATMTKGSMLQDERVYTFPQSDRLLKVSDGTSRRWIDGRQTRKRIVEPLIRLETTRDPMATWGEFSEAKLIEEYRSRGVPVIRMRPAIMRLREVFNTKYPLALARPFLDVEGKELVYKAQESTGLDEDLWLVARNNQGFMPTLPVQRFMQQAEYEDNVVTYFKMANNIWMNPRYASGEPTFRGRRLRVDTVIHKLTAGFTPHDLRELYSLTSEAIDDAIQYSWAA